MHTGRFFFSTRPSALFCASLLSVSIGFLACSGDETGSSGTFQNSGSTSTGSNSSGNGQGGSGGDCIFGCGTGGSTGQGGAPVACDPDKTDGPLQNAKSFGGDLNQAVSSIALDSMGNYYVAGTFAGSMDLGAGALTSAGKTDVFVGKWNAGGQLQWAKRFGNASDQNVRGIAVDPQGNVYITGSFLGQIDFGGGALVQNGCCFEDIYIAKFDTNGTYLWAKDFGDDGWQKSYAIAADANGVVIAGSFQQALDLGGGALQAMGGGTFDLFVAKFSLAGGHLWSKGYGDDADQAAWDLALDGTGNVYVSGNAKGTIDFGKGAHSSMTVDGSAVVAKLDPSGGTVWSGLFGDSATAYAIDADAAGGFAVTGAFKGMIDFGGEKLAGGSSADSVFVARFDAQNKHKWSKVFGTASTQGNAIAVDTKGKVWLGGLFQQSVNFGGLKLTSAGSFDAFLVKFDTAGCHVWSKAFGNEQYQGVVDIAADASGNAAVVGNFSGSIDLGGGALTATGDDWFLSTFAP